MIKQLSLSEFFANRVGSVNPSNFEDEEFELYSIPAYESGFPEKLFGREIGSSKKKLKGGDVLLSRIVPHIRRCWIVPEKNDLRQIGSGEWIVFRSNDIDSSYLRYYLMSNEFHAKFMNTVKGVGGSLLRADPKLTGKLKIPLPPVATQKKIAAILDAADAHRQKTRQLLAKYDELAQSIFLEMFGDPVTNPKGWKLGEIADLVTEVKYGTSAKAEDGGTFEYLRMNNITYQGDMDYSSLKFINLAESEIKKYTTKKYDILFNRTNSKELVGKTGIILDNKIRAIAGYLIRIRLNELGNPFYVWSHLNSRWAKLTLEKMCKNIVGMANINAKELQKIQILIPPIELQNIFQKKIELINVQKTKLIQSLEKSENLFNSLLQKAFKGGLNV